MDSWQDQPLVVRLLSASCRPNARRLMRALILIASPVALLLAQPAERVVPAGHIVVQTGDVTRFFKVLNANHGRPRADDLQHGYLDADTDALRSFTDSRIGSMERLASVIQHKPSLFAKARTCGTALPSIRTRVAAAVDQLGALLPSARFPPVTVLVGRGNSGGVTTEAGVVIGLEALCNVDWMQADVSDHFVHLIAHEYVHVQQPGARVDVEQASCSIDAAGRRRRIRGRTDLRATGQRASAALDAGSRVCAGARVPAGQHGYRSFEVAVQRPQRRCVPRRSRLLDRLPHRPCLCCARARHAQRHRRTAGCPAWKRCSAAGSKWMATCVRSRRKHADADTVMPASCW